MAHIWVIQTGNHWFRVWVGVCCFLGHCLKGCHLQNAVQQHMGSDFTQFGFWPRYGIQHVNLCSHDFLLYCTNMRVWDSRKFTDITSGFIDQECCTRRRHEGYGQVIISNSILGCNYLSLSVMPAFSTTLLIYDYSCKSQENTFGYTVKPVYNNHLINGILLYHPELI